MYSIVLFVYKSYVHMYKYIHTLILKLWNNAKKLMIISTGK
jgi:hypothetical protein